MNLVTLTIFQIYESKIYTQETNYHMIWIPKPEFNFT